MKKIKAFLLMISCILFPLSKAFAMGDFDISGPWFHDGQPVSIQNQYGNHYVFCNEQNDCANGYVSFPGKIFVPQWHVMGRLQGDGSAIFWSNSTTWMRNGIVPVNPPYPPTFNPMMLNGPWTHNGQSTFITVYGNGQLSITNESQQTYQGYMAGNRMIYIPQLGINGFVNYRANQIRWSNNTVWQR